ncbi:hypothetical protein C1646_102812 [Rhizophagus diaphanus]|nr:hypothetical protein C1646_102812 [Rhizophagus diaphanus] [Rhizophagus sp. MUCL 43196]
MAYLHISLLFLTLEISSIAICNIFDPYFENSTGSFIILKINSLSSFEKSLSKFSRFAGKVGKINPSVTQTLFSLMYNFLFDLVIKIFLGFSITQVLISTSSEG